MREAGLGHAGHADDIRPVALQAPYFRGAFETGALGGPVGTAFHHLHFGARRRLDHGLAQLLAIRMGEIDVGHLFVLTAEEGVRASAGVVDDLVGNHQRAGSQIVGRDAADGVDGDHLVDAGVFYRPDVGAIVDLVRRDRVPGPVTRQKHRFLPAELPENHGRRRFAVRRADHFAARDAQILEIGQTTAANNRHCRHKCSPTSFVLM